MKTLHAIAAAALLALAGCTSEPAGPEGAARADLVTKRAVVETVDVEGRQVLLRGEDGRMMTLTADETVRNLAQLESGDVVRFEYYESVTARMAAEGDPSEPVAVVAAERAAEGQKPGAAAGSMVEMVVEFVSYDPATHVVSFITPDGKPHSIVARPEMREFAATRRAGDRIDVTITQAVAVSVEPVS